MDAAIKNGEKFRAGKIECALHHSSLASRRSEPQLVQPAATPFVRSMHTAFPCQHFSLRMFCESLQLQHLSLKIHVLTYHQTPPLARACSPQHMRSNFFAHMLLRPTISALVPHLLKRLPTFAAKLSFFQCHAICHVACFHP